MVQDSSYSYSIICLKYAYRRGSFHDGLWCSQSRPIQRPDSAQWCFLMVAAAKGKAHIPLQQGGKKTHHLVTGTAVSYFHRHGQSRTKHLTIVYILCMRARLLQLPWCGSNSNPLRAIHLQLVVQPSNMQGLYNVGENCKGTNSTMVNVLKDWGFVAHRLACWQRPSCCLE